MEFKPGDVVTLKSGGPRMTVNTVKGQYAEVGYWDSKNNAVTYQELSFHMIQIFEAPDIDLEL